MAAKRKGKVGRPKAKVDDSLVAEYALDGCSNRCIGELLDVSEHTISRHFGALLAKKRAERRHGLRKVQTALALGGDRTMLIWLGKNELGQSDAPTAPGEPEPQLDEKVG